MKMINDALLLKLNETTDLFHEKCKKSKAVGPSYRVKRTSITTPTNIQRGRNEGQKQQPTQLASRRHSLERNYSFSSKLYLSDRQNELLKKHYRDSKSPALQRRKSTSSKSLNYLERNKSFSRESLHRRALSDEEVEQQGRRNEFQKRNQSFSKMNRYESAKHISYSSIVTSESLVASVFRHDERFKVDGCGLITIDDFEPPKFPSKSLKIQRALTTFKKPELSYKPKKRNFERSASLNERRKLSSSFLLTISEERRSYKF